MKANRRNASIWVPDVDHEAMRDLIRLALCDRRWRERVNIFREFCCVTGTRRA
ncbi:MULTISPECIES: hypothetical protein [Mesorhizobium]|uniref:hypothetical protein n=1 Tax=Mesorhizobium TaxID=68287 RepID=UPI001596B996|nr:MULTISPECIES: hypothetical protein [Mesorhizobium]